MADVLDTKEAASPKRTQMAAAARSERRIEQRLSEHGIRLTGQRRVIAQVLWESDDHPDVEELHRRAVALDAKISRSTVYRTVKLLAALGILDRHDFGAGRAHYERRAGEHHDHLIDMESGAVIEFHSTEIEAIQERIAAELGFELVGHRLELFGVRKPPAKPKSSPR